MEEIKGMVKGRHLRIAVQHVRNRANKIPVTDEEYQWSMDVLNALFNANGETSIPTEYEIENVRDTNSGWIVMWFERRNSAGGSFFLRNIESSILDERYPIDAVSHAFFKKEREELESVIRAAEETIADAKEKLEELMKGR